MNHYRDPYSPTCGDPKGLESEESNGVFAVSIIAFLIVGAVGIIIDWCL
jgi:hypothetical protein